MSMTAIVLLSFFLAVALLAVLWRSGRKPAALEPFRAELRDKEKRYFGYARFDTNEKYLKVVLRNMDDLGVDKGEELRIVVNGAESAKLVWQETRIKTRLGFDALSGSDLFQTGMPVEIRHGEKTLLAGKFGD
jgi:hypothetical protein